jgi:hypothetical protein
MDAREEGASGHLDRHLIWKLRAKDGSWAEFRTDEGLILWKEIVNGAWDRGLGLNKHRADGVHGRRNESVATGVIARTLSAVGEAGEHTPLLARATSIRVRIVLPEGAKGSVLLQRGDVGVEFRPVDHAKHIDGRLDRGGGLEVPIKEGGRQDVSADELENREASKFKDSWGRGRITVEQVEQWILEYALESERSFEGRSHERDIGLAI